MKKLNYLLVMPRFVESLKEGYNFPLGIAYISSVLKAEGFNVFNLNLNHLDGEIETIINQEISAHKIDVVLTGGLSYQFINLKNIIDAVKNNHPSLKIIMGGGIITGDPHVAMEALQDVDFGVVGEGEITIVELAKALENGTDFDDIDGIIFKKDSDYFLTKPRKEIMDLDAIPLPDYEGFELDKYLQLPPMSINNVLKNRSFYMAGSRSCPYQCTFCFHTVGKIYRQRSIENVLEEVRFLKEKYNVEHIRMSDELFARDKERIKVFSDALKELGITWSASFRVDDVDEKLIEIIKSGTCRSMDFGIESADNNILKSMKKKITIEQTEKALSMAYKSGIPMAGIFIFGDIEETMESAQKTLDWWKNHKEYNIGLNFISTYPGTFIYKYALENGIIKDPVQFLKDGCPQVNISKLSDEELRLLAKNVLELTLDEGLKIKNPKLVEYSTQGRMTIEGECPKCNHLNLWKNAKPFVGGNWVTCAKCSQRYVAHATDDMQRNLIQNIEQKLKENKKIGIWGITAHTIKMFDEEEIFKNENIIFMDNASVKKLLYLNSKQVFDPEILADGDIETVIFFYPNSYENIYSQVKERYPQVKNFINVLDCLTTL